MSDIRTQFRLSALLFPRLLHTLLSALLARSRPGGPQKGKFDGKVGGIPPPVPGHAAQPPASSLRFCDQACSVEAADLSSAHLVGSDGAAFRRVTRGPEGLRPYAPAQGRAARRTNHCDR